MADDHSPRASDEPTPASLAPPSLGPPGLGISRLRRRRKPADAVPDTGRAVDVDVDVDVAPAPTETRELPVRDEPTRVAPVLADPTPEAPTGLDPDAPADPPPPIDFHPPSSAAPLRSGADTDDDSEAGDAGVAARSYRVPGRVAAVLVGLIVGALLVVATAGAGRACDSTDTGTCGGLGVLLLVAIVIAAVLAGTLLLRLLKVPEAGSTSFLAVGLTVVVALLFFVEQLTEWWMVIVIPLVSVATYLAAHWVTDTYGDATFD